MDIFKPDKILFAISAIVGLIGTLIIIYADSRIIKTKADSLVDKVSPFFLKDVEISASTIYKEKFFDPHNKKMKNIKFIGIVLIVIAPLITLVGIFCF